jgi:predicted ATPase/class 3 adenylate cyclase
LPDGQVALMFTDVEGSTLLAARLGERWPEVLATQRRLLREEVVAHGGVEVDAAGDGLFFAFGGEQAAERAAAAAEGGQRRLAAVPWPDQAELRVRIGIHVGRPLRGEDSYAGVEVHKAARIADAANGGQVLCSRQTAERLPERTLRDLGEFRLKDLTAAERLYLLELEGLPVDSRSPRSLNATNLPLQPLPLIGRAVEVKQAVELVERGVRLVTFTGAGGIGKTRLALEVAAELAHRFANAVYWVPLATVVLPEHVAGTVAAMVGAPTESDGLVRFLRDKRLLLVADNFEHVLPAAPLVAELLQAAPGLTVLATSRAPLHLSAETELTVGELGEYAAVELFVARAQTVMPDFEPSPRTAEICRRLDGIPLALELAAARLRHFGEETLLARLDRSLDLLTGGPADMPERQQTLRGVIAWSYQLLAPDGRRLLNRLSVFAGRATLELAERVCGDGVDVLEHIGALVDQNLLRFFRSPGEQEHYFMLESVRAFALEQLAASGELDVIRRRHRDVYLELCESAQPITGMAGIQLLLPERANLRAALRFSLDSEPAAEKTLRLAYTLWRYFLETGSITEGQAWLEEALSGAPEEPSLLMARALDAAGLVAAQRGEFQRALELNEQARAHAEEVVGGGLALGWIWSRRGQILIDLGALDDAVAALVQARSLFDRSPLARAWTLIELGRSCILAGDNDGALTQFREAQADAAVAGEPVAAAYAQALAGCALAFSGDVSAGLAAAEHGLELLRRERAQFTLTIALLHTAPAFRQAEQTERERETVGEAIRLALDSGVVPRAGACLEAAARLAVDNGNPEAAARLWGVADRLAAELGVVPTPLRLQLRARAEQLARDQLGDVGLRAGQQAGAGAHLSVTEALELAAQALAAVAHPAAA